MSAVAHIDDYKSGLHYSDEFRGEMSWNGYEANNLLRNEGCREGEVDQAGDSCTLRFSDVAHVLGADDLRDSRGVAVTDIDNDGDLDLAINHNTGYEPMTPQGPAALLRNDVGSSRGWLSLQLRGTTSNRDAIGAVVSLEAGGLRQTRQRTAGSGYASQQSGRLHFGLGDAPSVDRLTIRWPSGKEETFEDIPARSRIRITEGEGLEVLSAGH